MRAEKNEAYDEKRADARRFNDIKQVGNTGKSPHSAIEIEIKKNSYLGYKNKRQHPIQQSQMLLWDIKIKSHHVCKIK